MATNWPNSVQTFTNPSAGSALNSPSHADQHITVNDTVEALQNYAGLVFVKSQTVGSGVSSVTVTDAFSSTFENYKILYTGWTMSSTVNLLFSLGATINTNGWTGVVTSRSFFTGVADATYNNQPPLAVGVGSSVPGRASADIFVTRPAVPGRTGMKALSTGERSILTTCMFDGTGAYADFTFSTSSGTLSGGTIRVYGFNDG